MPESILTNSRLNRNQVSIGQLMVLAVLIAIPLSCFLNYHQRVTNTTDGSVIGPTSASGFALLWLVAGISAVVLSTVYLLFRRQKMAAAVYGVLLLTPCMFFGSTLYSTYARPDSAPNRVAVQNCDIMSAAIVATNQFVLSNEGRWPESWGDLQSFIAVDEFKAISSGVDFDFAADPSKLKNQEWHEFTGIVARKPAYNMYRVELIELIELLND